MAYREYGFTDNGDIINANQSTETEEERKRKLANIVSMISGQQTPMETGYNILKPSINKATQSVEQTGQMIENPEEEFKKRLEIGRAHV